jgi:hypothetical protein
MDKICSKCKEKKNIEEFTYFESNRTKDKRSTHCKSCAVKTAINWASKHGKEKSRVIQKKYSFSDKGRVCRAKAQRKYDQKNKEKIILY